MSKINSNSGNGLISLNITNSNNEIVDYRFSSNRLQRRVDSGAWQNLTSSGLIIEGGFYVRKSDSPGRAVVTIVMKVGSQSESSVLINLQNSVSARAF